MKIIQIASLDTEVLTVRPFEEGREPVQLDAFRAEKGEMWWFSMRELWFGLGKEPKLPALTKIFRSLFYKRKDRWPLQVTLDARGRNAAWIGAAVNGIMLGGYDIQLYKTEPELFSDFFKTGRLNILTDPGEDISLSVINAQKTATVQMKIMDLMNAPGSHKVPQTLADWAVKSGAKSGYDVRILTKTDLQSQGMHALLAVNKGSTEPPVMIVSEYKPAHFTKTVALVGKGVTFDTGGISIKTSANMHLMKSDMGGAAAVLGTMELAAQMQLPVHLVGIVPATENVTDGAGLKPGDVIQSYSGKTIEVIDTDAEGRLILADGLSYAVKNYTPDVLIDLATLTGSVIQTLGYEAAGLFTPNDDLAAQLIAAGEATGERLWRLPVWDEYREEISSDIADVKNYHGKPLAGAIVAAKFLEFFTEKHSSWAHLDIAGTAFGDTEFAPGRAGTAYGIRLLIQFLSNF